jgi:hypothetical protein
MTRTDEYRGFTLQVSVESGLSFRPIKRPAAHSGYVAVVRVFRAGNAVAWRPREGAARVY